MFSGVSTLNLDAKGRLAVPARHREVLSQGGSTRVVVTINPDDKARCLLLYADTEWVEIARNLSRRDTMNPKIRAMQRLVVGYASELELDGQGRILLSSELRDFAGLDKRVSLVGQFNKIEIWDEAAWAGSREHWLSELASGDGMDEELKGLML